MMEPGEVIHYTKEQYLPVKKLLLKTVKAHVKNELKVHGYKAYPRPARRFFSEVRKNISGMEACVKKFEERKEFDVNKMVGHKKSLEPLDVHLRTLFERTHPLVGVPVAVRQIEKHAAELAGVKEGLERLKRIQAGAEIYGGIDLKTLEEVLGVKDDAQYKQLKISEEDDVIGAERLIANQKETYRGVLKACARKLEDYEQTAESKQYARLINGLHDRIKEIHKKLS
jgi:hypothetical protein